MFRQFIVLVLVVVAVQAKPDDRLAQKVFAGIKKQAESARTIADVPKPDLIRASCVNEYTFVPLTKETVENSKKCLAGIKNLSDFIEKNLAEERDEIEMALDKAAEKPHTVFDHMELTAKTQKYFKKLFCEAKKNKDIRKDLAKYINECVKKVTEEIMERTGAAKDRVKECFEED